MRRLATLLTMLVLAGCAGAGTLPDAPRSTTSAPGDVQARRPADTGVTQPGETSRGLPGETSWGLPGETSWGLPGETSRGLPGATFACPGLPSPGSANCTIALNLNVPPNPNAALAAASIPGLHPADVLDAYRLDASAPGMTVAIVDAYDLPSAEADLGVYRAAFGLRPCTGASGCFRKVNQSGQSGSYPPADPGWGAEIALDLDMVSAVCPNCSIVLVEASSPSIDDLGAAVDQAVALGAHVVSNSYYALEWSGESSEDAHYRHPGVAVTAASGDRGYPSYPSVSPTVTSVGATSLTGGRGAWTQSPWKYTGSGCSAFEAKPSWQPQAFCGNKRSAVDMAVVGDPQTGVATFCSTCIIGTWTAGWYVAGGTSVGAPIVAAAYALSANPRPVAYSYEHGSSFTTVDRPYSALAGLGSPNGTAGL